MSIILIPTQRQPSYGADAFKSDAVIIIEGGSKQGGPGGWFVGGWGKNGEGRTEVDGPMIPGPYAYMGGRAGVMDNHGGTGAILKRAEAEGNLFRLAAGDCVALAGERYTLSLCPRGYPKLTPF